MSRFDMNDAVKITKPMRRKQSLAGAGGEASGLAGLTKSSDQSTERPLFMDAGCDYKTSGGRLGKDNRARHPANPEFRRAEISAGLTMLKLFPRDQWIVRSSCGLAG